MASAVRIEHLDYTVNGKVIFEDLSLTIPEKKITAIFGPSGCGKTTLIRLIGGAIRPDKGKIILNGHNVQELSEDELFSLRKNIGVLFQNNGLLTDLNLFDNVALPLRVHTDFSENDIKRKTLEKIEAVGLLDAVDKFPHELSGGMARRGALARAVVMNPSVVFYDEPFTGQDPQSMARLMQLIKQLNERFGLTSIIVTHDIAEGMSLADKVLLLTDKRVLAEGTPAEVKEHQDNRVHDFMRGVIG